MELLTLARKSYESLTLARDIVENTREYTQGNEVAVFLRIKKWLAGCCV